jgi:hypothetical protein
MQDHPMEQFLKVCCHELETYLQNKANQYIKGTTWSFKYEYIRQSINNLVYRLHFYVWMKKVGVKIVFSFKPCYIYCSF